MHRRRPSSIWRGTLPVHRRSSKALRSSFDVALIYLPPSWAACFEGENFDFHDYLKAFCAPSNIPIQIMRQSVSSGHAGPMSCGDLSVALYAKAGGMPGSSFGLNRDEAFIGISYAMKRRTTAISTATCCSQVFDPDGTGFQFVAYDAKDSHRTTRKNPYFRTTKCNPSSRAASKSISADISARVPEQNHHPQEHRIQGRGNSWRDRQLPGRNRSRARPDREERGWQGIRFDSKSPPEPTLSSETGHVPAAQPRTKRCFGRKEASKASHVENPASMSTRKAR